MTSVVLPLELSSNTKTPLRNSLTVAYSALGGFHENSSLELVPPLATSMFEQILWERFRDILGWELLRVRNTVIGKCQKKTKPFGDQMSHHFIIFHYISKCAWQVHGGSFSRLRERRIWLARAEELFHAFLQRKWSTYASVPIIWKLRDKFLKKLIFSRIINFLYGIQVLTPSKYCKAMKQGLQCANFWSQISCLQVRALIIHGYCLQVLHLRKQQ